MRASLTTVATRAASSLTPKPAATTCAISWRLAPSHTPYTNSGMWKPRPSRGYSTMPTVPSRVMMPSASAESRRHADARQCQQRNRRDRLPRHAEQDHEQERAHVERVLDPREVGEPEARRREQRAENEAGEGDDERESAERDPPRYRIGARHR